VEPWLLALAAFLVTSGLILWRPGGVHEAVPALLGGLFVFTVGLADLGDVLLVVRVVGNAALTIVATFVMATILEGAGFFRYTTERLLERAAGSGHRLFHLLLAFSACLTLFLNNDGSILIGTPVVAELMRRLRLKAAACFAYLISACLVASAASAPVAVSNMANLEAMSIVGISLVNHLRYMLIPGVAGLAACWVLLYLWVRRRLPAVIGLPSKAGQTEQPADPAFMWFAAGVVVAVRIGIFLSSVSGLPSSVVTVAGALFLLAANAYLGTADPRRAVARAPWPVMGFAFGMDLVVFGLKNAGVTGLLAAHLEKAVANPLPAAFLPGLLTAGFSSLLNNHAGLIVGALTLLEIRSLGPAGLQVTYAGVMLGSDLGALLTPIGTLASLIWFHLLRQYSLPFTWADYLRVTLAVIPASFLFGLFCLYLEALVVMAP
jgi:arsenical pump membrane protein